MKRLQLRHLNRVFENRGEAQAFLRNIVDLNTAEGQDFVTAKGGSLYAEPMVLKYKDEDENVKVILAIGTDSGTAAYHIIDTASLEEDLNEVNQLIGELGDDVADLSEKVDDNIASIAVCDHELDANVKEEYVLKNNKGEELGAHIKIYKDSALVDAQLAGSGVTEFIKTENGYEPVGEQDASKEVLYLLYMTENGDIKFVGIDFERFILEAEVSSGLTVTENHEIAIKIDDADEGFLVAGADGLKTEGVGDAIQNAADSLSETLMGEIISDRVSSKDILVTKTASGTDLTIQVDGKTIAKNLLYENGVAVLSSPIRISAITSNDASLKAEYALVDADGNVIGETIKLQKEGDLKEVKLGRIDDTIDTNTGTIIEGSSSERALVFVYVTSSGYQLVKAGLADYFTENIFADGLSTDGSIVSVRKAAGSEDYLRIDTAGVAIVGVSSAISIAAQDAVSAANTYTDGKISALSSNTVSAVDNLSSSLSDKLGLLSGSVIDEKSLREQNDQALSSEISALETYVNETFETKDKSATNLSSAVTKVMSDVAQVSANTLSQAKDYADGKISDAVAEINGIKVVDVVYDTDVNSPKYIQLRLADGTLTDGFDASEFIKDEVLSSVELVGDNLIFTWNDDANTQMEVPLSSFSDIYTVNSGSVSYLKVDGKEIGAIVDKEGGFAKTLATTSYADTAASTAADALRTELTAAIEDSATATAQDLEALDNELSRRISANTASIETLNGLENVQGSVLHKIDDKLAKDLITGGLPATDITIEDAKQHSLLRVINVNGEDRYYVSSRADEMLYVTSAGTTTNLNDYINGLETRIKELEELADTLGDRVDNLENTALNENDIKNIIKNFVVGTTNEIKIEESDDKLKVGFADDAVFGEYLAG